MEVDSCPQWKESDIQLSNLIYQFFHFHQYGRQYKDIQRYFLIPKIQCSPLCQGLNLLLILRMVIQPLIGNPEKTGFFQPLRTWVDDHLQLQGTSCTSEPTVRDTPLSNTSLHLKVELMRWRRTPSLDDNTWHRANLHRIPWDPWYIYRNENHKTQTNVGKYTIHGPCG